MVGRMEIAWPVGQCATRDDATVSAGRVEQTLDLVELHAVLQRADGGTLLQAVADHGGFGQFGQPGADLVIDRAVDIGALDRQADLPGIHEGAREQSRRNLGRIGARQHDGRVVAAQFQRQPLDG